MNASPRMVRASPPTTTPTAQPGTESRSTRLPSSRTINRLNCLGLGIVRSALERDHRQIPGRHLRHRARLGHTAVPLEQDPLLEHHHGGLHVTVDPRRPLQLDPLHGPQVADDFPVHHQAARPDIGLEDRALPDDQGVVGADLALELTVQHHGAAERVTAFDLRPLVDEGRQLASSRALPSSSEHKTCPLVLDCLVLPDYGTRWKGGCWLQFRPAGFLLARQFKGCQPPGLGRGSASGVRSISAPLLTLQSAPQYDRTPGPSPPGEDPWMSSTGSSGSPLTSSRSSTT